MESGAEVRDAVIHATNDLAHIARREKVEKPCWNYMPHIGG